MVSVICVYNNEKQLKNQLFKSLENQSIDYEKIFLDSRKYNFKSAAEALNYGASISNGDILIFSHQDIYIKGTEELEKFTDAIFKCKVGTIIGTQGVIEKSKKYYSNLTAGKEFDERNCNDYKETLIKVSCFDEGFFGMKKKTWEQHRFDEILCDNWHLYAVEMCLYARKNKNDVLVLPIQIHHFSYGRINIEYMKGLYKICNAYKNDFKYVWTTCYKVRTNNLYIKALILIWIINRKIRGRSLE